MKNKFRKTISMLLLVCYTLLIGQQNYPYFSDPNKQLIFEKYRVYIIEKKGTNTITYGGGSKTELANPIQSIFGNQEPQYVAKHEPVKSYNVDYHKFKIEQNGRQISEIDLLSLMGLEAEINNIMKNYNEKINLYEREIAKIKSEPYDIEYKKMAFVDNAEICNYSVLLIGGVHAFTGLVMGSHKAVRGLTDDGLYIYEVTILSMVYFIIGSIPKKTKIVEKKRFPKKPKLEMVMTTEQIKSLTESYNHNLYNKIKDDN